MQIPVKWFPLVSWFLKLFFLFAREHLQVDIFYLSLSVGCGWRWWPSQSKNNNAYASRRIFKAVCNQSPTSRRTLDPDSSICCPLWGFYGHMRGVWRDGDIRWPRKRVLQGEGEIKGVAALNGTPKKAARDAGEIKRVLIKEDEELKVSPGCTPIVPSSAVALK